MEKSLGKLMLPEGVSPVDNSFSFFMRGPACSSDAALWIQICLAASSISKPILVSNLYLFIYLSIYLSIHSYIHIYLIIYLQYKCSMTDKTRSLPTSGNLLSSRDLWIWLLIGEVVYFSVLEFPALSYLLCCQATISMDNQGTQE
jgi:hypothetical protein